MWEFLASLRQAQELLWTEFRPAWLAALAAGCSLPILGSHAQFRGQSAAVIAIPQTSFAGMAIALAWPALSLDQNGEPIISIVLAGALLGAGAGIALGARLRRGHSGVTSMLALWIIATAVTEIARAVSPVGGTRLEPLLHGEVLGLTPSKATMVMGLLALAAIVVGRHHRLIATAAFPDTSQAQGASPQRDAVFWSLVMGIAITLGTTTLGPTLTAGLLLIPAWLARYGATNIASMIRDAVTTGVVGVVLGSWGAVLGDLPLGPAILIGCVATGTILGIIRRRRAVADGPCVVTSSPCESAP